MFCEKPEGSLISGAVKGKGKGSRKDFLRVAVF